MLFEINIFIEHNKQTNKRKEYLQRKFHFGKKMKKNEQKFMKVNGQYQFVWIGKVFWETAQTFYNISHSQFKAFYSSSNSLFFLLNLSRISSSNNKLEKFKLDFSTFFRCKNAGAFNQLQLTLMEILFCGGWQHT